MVFLQDIMQFNFLLFMWNNVLLITFLFWSVHAQAQQIKLNGQVINVSNSEPIAGVLIVDKLNGNQVLTDADIARSYRSQADAMYKEAARLRKQADELDPPKKKTTKTVDAEETV